MGFFSFLGDVAKSVGNAVHEKAEEVKFGAESYASQYSEDELFEKAAYAMRDKEMTEWMICCTALKKFGYSQDEIKERVRRYM